MAGVPQDTSDKLVDWMAVEETDRVAIAKMLAELAGASKAVTVVMLVMYQV